MRVATAASPSAIYEPAVGGMKRNLDHVIRAHCVSRASIEAGESATDYSITTATSDPIRHCCPEPGCDRQFSRKYTLVEHLKTHTGEKPHVCPVRTCSKRFSTSGNLARHKRLHGYIEPLECPVEGCVCTFPSDNKLEKHMKFHYGNAVLVCEVLGCGKTFSTTGNLNRHMKNHHPGVATPRSGEQYSVSEEATSSTPASRVESLQTEPSTQQHESTHSDVLDELAAILDEEIDFVESSSNFGAAVTAATDDAAPSVSQPDSVESPSPSQKRQRRTVLEDMVGFHVSHLG